MNHRNTFKEETMLARKHLAKLESMARELDVLDEQWEKVIGDMNPGYRGLHFSLDKLKRQLHQCIGGWRRESRG
ncbi:hypothetical protein HYK36_004235 [Salmonella enterica]|nr:hypothetical protein [Salmonella enterica]